MHINQLVKVPSNWCRRKLRIRTIIIKDLATEINIAKIIFKKKKSNIDLLDLAVFSRGGGRRLGLILFFSLLAIAHMSALSWVSSLLSHVHKTPGRILSAPAYFLHVHHDTIIEKFHKK
jgi:hypothetical protein